MSRRDASSVAPFAALYFRCAATRSRRCTNRVNSDDDHSIDALLCSAARFCDHDVGREKRQHRRSSQRRRRQKRRRPRRKRPRSRRERHRSRPPQRPPEEPSKTPAKSAALRLPPDGQTSLKHRPARAIARASRQDRVLTCRDGSEDRHARIALVRVGGKTDGFAYYSKWKPRTCRSTYSATATLQQVERQRSVTNVNLERGHFRSSS